MNRKTAIALHFFEMSILLIVFLYFARGAVDHMCTYGVQLSVLMLCSKIGIILFFSLYRCRPTAMSKELRPWLYAWSGTFIAGLLRANVGSDGELGLTVQAVGMGLSIFGLLSLNTSFGVVAADRGIKTSGMYRIVRHPIYMAYTIGFAGFLMNHFSVANVLVLLIWFGLQLLRIREEEQVLCQNPDYSVYMAKIRYRVLPLVY